jgi:hypothetical protein
LILRRETVTDGEKQMADIENQWFGLIERLYAAGNDLAENIKLEDPENA